MNAKVTGKKASNTWPSAEYKQEALKVAMQI